MNEGAKAGGADSSERLMGLVYDELRQLAGAYLARERRDHTLQPTALVHEAFIKLSAQEAGWANRAQFVGVAAVAMRRVLVDHARQHKSQKRGGNDRRVDVDLSLLGGEEAEIDLVVLDEALTTLAQLAERQARVVELRYFGGLSLEEIAEVVDVSVRTVNSDWRFARAWLTEQLSGDA
ncbi:MAG: RNA polymerase sigma factor (TIGR02999 family) [Planctomycetota bacterium]|jgi:RNA polymerase sigma factor (TIGR02999 family)